MFYVGIDIAKNTHEAAILGDTGEPIGATLKIPNTTAGAQKFLSHLEKPGISVDNTPHRHGGNRSLLAGSLLVPA